MVILYHSSHSVSAEITLCLHNALLHFHHCSLFLIGGIEWLHLAPVTIAPSLPLFEILAIGAPLYTERFGQKTQQTHLSELTKGNATKRVKMFDYVLTCFTVAV